MSREAEPIDGRAAESLSFREAAGGCWSGAQLIVAIVGAPVGLIGAALLLVLLAGTESPDGGAAIVGGVAFAVALLHLALGLLSLVVVAHLAVRRLRGGRPPLEVSCLTGCATIVALALLAALAVIWLVILAAR